MGEKFNVGSILDGAVALKTGESFRKRVTPLSPTLLHNLPVCISYKLHVRHGVNMAVGVCVLAIQVGFIKDLVFPHVHVKYHN